jgi:hypothetical protein
MMTERLNISVLSAPLACIDRRALSQAWYSALRCAREAKTPAPLRPQPFAPQAPKRRANAAGAFRLRALDCGIAHVPSARNARVQRVVPGLYERRAERSSLAREIERIFLDPRGVARRSSFTIGKNGERVHVILQSKGDRVTLVAVCAPAMRAIVVKALAQARFALAGRRIALQVEREAVQCS